MRLNRRDFLIKSLQGLGGAVVAQNEILHQASTSESDKKSEKYLPRAEKRGKAENLIVDLLSRNQGLYYGETHDGNPGNSEFIINHLEQLYNAGVRVIALEMVDSEDQYLIDNYYSNPNDENRTALYNYTEKKLGGFSLIEAARKLGIKTIGIDMKARHLPTSGSLLESRPVIRREEVNEWWAKQVAMEMQRHSSRDKFIVYGGFYHSSKDETGVNSLLNIPSIVPINRNDYPKPFYSLEAGVIIIPGDNNFGDYQRVYAESYDTFFEACINHYENRNQEIAELYKELKGLIEIYLKGQRHQDRIFQVIDILLAQAEEYDKEYLRQLKEDIN